MTTEDSYTYCAWCWAQEHAGEPYPEEWSSTICPTHETAIYEQADQRRQQQREKEAATW